MVGKKLYVGNLTYRVSSSDLEQLFSQYGSVESAEVISDRDTGRSKGFGFVEMSSDNEARAAIEALNDQEHDGRRLTVNEARPREPRAGGGGGGGGGAVAAAAVAAVAVAVAAVAEAGAAATTAGAIELPAHRIATTTKSTRGPSRSTEPWPSDIESRRESSRLAAARCVSSARFARFHDRCAIGCSAQLSVLRLAAARGRRTASIVLRWANLGPKRSTKSLSEKSPSRRFSWLSST